MIWNKHGFPEDLEAAAADALLWLDILEIMVAQGRSKFIDPKSRELLGQARKNLADNLPAGARTERTDFSASATKDAPMPEAEQAFTEPQATPQEPVPTSPSQTP